MKWVVAVIVMFVVTLGAGVYAAYWGANEIAHFWIAVPAGDVMAPMVARGAGRPIALSPQKISLDQRGFLKNLLQPNVEALSTHWIYNLGTTPVRLRLELINCTIPVKWEVNANFPYDPQTHTFTQPLLPGQSIPNLGIDWIFEIPPGSGDLVYNGGLLLTDVDTGQPLTFIPIMIGSNLGGQSFAGGCCG